MGFLSLMISAPGVQEGRKIYPRFPTTHGRMEQMSCNLNSWVTRVVSTQPWQVSSGYRSISTNLNHKSLSSLTLKPPARFTTPSTSPIDLGSSLVAPENPMNPKLPDIPDVPADPAEPSEDFPEDASSRILYSLVSLPNTIAPHKSNGFHSEEEIAVNGVW